jgi:hypothetical protein
VYCQRPEETRAAPVGREGGTDELTVYFRPESRIRRSYPTRPHVKGIAHLPDRTSETLEEWLKAHPGIEVVSRDRYRPYIDAISTGAPKALQVADRWHLTKNLTDTIERLLERERISLDQALKRTLPEEPPFIPPLMRAYVKFCLTHGSGD